MAEAIYQLDNSNYLDYEGCSLNVYGDVKLSNLGLKKLPFHINECWGTIFDVSNNFLEDLSDCPFKVGESTQYNCSHNMLKSLYYSPRKVLSFDCSYNMLESLEGCPKVVDTFYANSNIISTLKYLPKKVRYLYLHYNHLTDDCLEDLLKKYKTYDSIGINGNRINDTMFDIFYKRFDMLKTLNEKGGKK
ncbi:MAG: hypothetical protein MJZ34_05000 [Paludibacteraceae bacterium]|nr:hypothetical protein [Paludibacteraceae bacterium]